MKFASRSVPPPKTWNSSLRTLPFLLFALGGAARVGGGDVTRVVKSLPVLGRAWTLEAAESPFVFFFVFVWRTCHPKPKKTPTVISTPTHLPSFLFPPYVHHSPRNASIFSLHSLFKNRAADISPIHIVRWLQTETTHRKPHGAHTNKHLPHAQVGAGGVALT